MIYLNMNLHYLTCLEEIVAIITSTWIRNAPKCSINLNYNLDDIHHLTPTI
jgi:hypothetical protein